jgi:hypothetical protein
MMIACVECGAVSVDNCSARANLFGTDQIESAGEPVLFDEASADLKNGNEILDAQRICVALHGNGRCRDTNPHQS